MYVRHTPGGGGGGGEGREDGPPLLIPQDSSSKANVRELTRETQPISAVHVHAALII